MPAEAQGPAEEVTAEQLARDKKTLELAKLQKEKGNAEFKKQAYAQAADLYLKAIKLSEMLRAPLPESQDASRELKLACLTNRALALSKMNDHRAVIATCDMALALDRGNEKALYRRAVALHELGDYASVSQAAAEFESVLSINPKNKDAATALKTAKKQLAQALSGGGPSPSRGNPARQRSSFHGLFQKNKAREEISQDSISYIGLRNEGATCYLNSVLQVLFHLPALRKAVFAIDTSGECPGAAPSVALALQRLMCCLQETAVRAPASATQLIASFGWDSDDTLTQQDCGELVTVLLDTLEEAMKGSEAEGEVSRLFSLSCVYEDRIHKPSSEGMQGWAARRDDPAHWPLTLHHIKECEGVPDALDKMMEVEVIEGFNTSSDYHDLQKAATKARERGAAAEVAALEAKQRAMEEEGKQGFGVQEIERRMLFMRLPPILFVNLQRLAYCPVRGVPMKINSRFAFAETLDLSARLARDAPEDPSGPPTYFLHSVIAHSGHSQVGHYVAYVRPEDEQSDWFKFDDGLVSRVSKQEAVASNYGGEAAPVSASPFSMLRARSAYMLVYVKRACASTVLGRSAIQCPEHVRREALKDQGTVSKLPTSLTVFLPDGRGSLGHKGARAPGNSAGEGEPVSKVRGLRVPVSLVDAEAARVGDLADRVRQICEENGVDFAPPELESFLHGVPPPGDAAPLSDPESDEEALEVARAARAVRHAAGAGSLRLCLTQLRGHEIDSVLDCDEPLGQAGAGLVLRLEWFDLGAMRVPVTQCSISPQGGIRRHGDPVLLPVYDGEQVGPVKQRLAVMLGLREGEDLDDWELFWYSRERRQSFCLEDDSEELVWNQELLRDWVLMVSREDQGDGPTAADFFAHVQGAGALQDRMRVRINSNSAAP